jgi:transcriptional regulator with XRE-family HTH domain
MPKKKADIKEILAANLRENRRKKGLTQEKLAEMADISLRYLAMLELGNSFPSGEMLEKLAKALDIQAFQLFNPTATTEGALLHLEQSIVINIEKIISDTVKQTVKEAFEDTIKCYEPKPK